jgi:hypothetical protein
MDGGMTARKLNGRRNQRLWYYYYEDFCDAYMAELWGIKPLSTIFQLYRGSQFY